MKIVKLSLIFILSLLILVSCEKFPFDYRNKYLGNWRFDISETQLVYNVAQGFHDTITLRTCNGEFKYGSEHSAILFNGNGYSHEFQIDKKGVIVSEVDDLPNYSESGGFEGSSVFKYYYYHQMGGSREHYGIDIYGEKE